MQGNELITALHIDRMPLHPHIHRVTDEISSFDPSITRSGQIKSVQGSSYAPLQNKAISNANCAALCESVWCRPMFNELSNNITVRR